MELSSFGASFIYRDRACIGKQHYGNYGTFGGKLAIRGFRELDICYSYESIIVDYELCWVLLGKHQKNKGRQIPK